jgi:hypothetical protein
MLVVIRLPLIVCHLRDRDRKASDLDTLTKTFVVSTEVCWH